jgi:hypothetical protein
MSVDIDRYSSPALLGVSLKEVNDGLSFLLRNSSKSPCLSIPDVEFDITFRFFSRKLSWGTMDFGIWIFFTTRISENSLSIKPFEIIPHLGEF